MRWASVVLPVPGGPQRMTRRRRPAGSRRRSGFPGASRCAWPTNSSRVRGRMRAASGRAGVEKSSGGLVHRATSLPRSRARGALEPGRSAARPAEERQRGRAQPRLAWNSGTRLEAATYSVTPGGQREPVPRQRRAPLGEQHAQHRGDARAPRRPAIARRRALPAGQHHARDGDALGQLVQQHREEQQHAEPRRHQESARDGHAVEEGVEGEADQRRCSPPCAATAVGLLAEVEVRREDVLGQVDREVPEQHESPGGRRPAPRSTSGSTPTRTTASMNPAPNARQVSMNARPAPLVAHHRQGADHVAQRRGHREPSSGFSASVLGQRRAASRACCSVGSSSTRVEQPLEQPAPPPGPAGIPAARRSSPVIARSPRAERLAPRPDRRHRRRPTGPALPCRSSPESARSSAAPPTAREPAPDVTASSSRPAPAAPHRAPRPARSRVRRAEPAQHRRGIVGSSAR